MECYLSCHQRRELIPLWKCESLDPRLERATKTDWKDSFLHPGKITFLPSHTLSHLPVPLTVVLHVDRRNIHSRRPAHHPRIRRHQHPQRPRRNTLVRGETRGSRKLQPASCRSSSGEEWREVQCEDVHYHRTNHLYLPQRNTSLTVYKI